MNATVGSFWVIFAMVVCVFGMAYFLGKFLNMFLKKWGSVSRKDVQGVQTVWNLRDVMLCMQTMKDEDLAKELAMFEDFDHRQMQQTKDSLVNIIFKKQSGPRW